MLTLHRRLRAILAVTATWGMAWSALGFALASALAVLDPAVAAPASIIDAVLAVTRAGANGATAGLTFGGLTGLTFAGVLRGMERRRTGQLLSAYRLTAWGGVAAILWLAAWVAVLRPGDTPGVHGPSVWVLFLVTGVLGACSGWLTWRVARHADQVAAAERGAAALAMAQRASLAAGAGVTGPPPTRSRSRVT